MQCTRRHSILLLASLPLVLNGCFEDSKTGPVDIHWDRDSCALCNMIISDARFAAQVRGGPKRNIYKFDDIGCAVNWLNKKPWAGDPETEIWVAEKSSTREKVTWLKARDARYVKGEQTPMNYGFGAVAASIPGSIDFVAVTNIILANAPNHICRTPDDAGRAGS